MALVRYTNAQLADVTGIEREVAAKLTSVLKALGVAEVIGQAPGVGPRGANIYQSDTFEVARVMAEALRKLADPENGLRVEAPAPATEAPAQPAAGTAGAGAEEENDE